MVPGAVETSCGARLHLTTSHYIMKLMLIRCIYFVQNQLVESWEYKTHTLTSQCSWARVTKGDLSKCGTCLSNEAEKGKVRMQYTAAAHKVRTRIRSCRSSHVKFTWCSHMLDFWKTDVNIFLRNFRIFDLIEESFADGNDAFISLTAPDNLPARMYYAISLVHLWS